MKNKKIIFIAATFCGLLASCGAEAPNIRGNECSEKPLTGTGGTASPQSSASSIASSTSTGQDGQGGAEAEKITYEVPLESEVLTRLHGCRKFTYTQLGNFLRSRGAIIPQGNLSDLRTTQTTVFETSTTLGTIFGGSGSSCEMAVTEANGTNDPICQNNETCFCNQSDKTNQANRSCSDVGNNADATDGYCVSKPATPGFLYFTGKDAFGVPKQDSRLAEKDDHSTASAMKLMDIFIQAAPQIISNIEDPKKAPACTLNGKNLPMFDPVDGSCIEESVSCLIGKPASKSHLLLCNLLIQKAGYDKAQVDKKRNIAIAALLSAAHICQ